MSDMVHQFQIDANRIRRQLKSASFQVGLDEIDGPCQKIFFQSKNSNRSRQTTAKCNQIEKN